MHVLAITIGSWEISAQYVFRGFVEGLTYGMVALGLVLIYKASGVINFAQGQFGAFGALLMTLINFNYGIPIGIGLPIAILCGAALGGITELLVVRRLFYQPRLLLFVATLGVSQLIIYLGYQLPEQKNQGTRLVYPELIRFDKPWSIGPVDISGDRLSVLIVVPIVCAILAYLLTRTKFGLSVRAAADNPGLRTGLRRGSRGTESRQGGGCCQAAETFATCSTSVSPSASVYSSSAPAPPHAAISPSTPAGSANESQKTPPRKNGP